MLNASKILLLASVAATLNGCGARSDISQRADLDSLVFDPAAQNVAVLLGSDGGNLDGVPIDIRGLKTLFSDATTGFNFTIEAEERNASVSMATEMLKRAAAKVGDRGTLLIYYSGHGAEGSGCMAFVGGCITFSTLAKAIQSVRTTPIKRLLFFSDSCFSGQLVTGSSAIISSAAGGGLTLSGADKTALDNIALSRAGDNWYTSLATSYLGSGSSSAATNRYDDGSGVSTSRGFETSLFEQALTVAAARPNQTSEDLGSEGGAFTATLRKVFSQLKSSGSSTTIRQFIDKTVADTSRSHSHTPVYRAFPSDVVLNDTMTGAGTPGTTGTTQPSVVPAQAINVMLNQSADANAILWGAADTSIASMTICNGDKALCSSVTRDDIVLKKAQTQGNRSFFFSDNALAFTDGYVFTIQGKDASGKPVLQRTVRIVKQL